MGPFSTSASSRDDTSGRYKMLFENSAEPILIIEGDKFVDCNQAAVDMLGYPNKSAVLENHPSEISPEYQPDGQLSVEKANGILARAKDVPYQCFEWTHVRADGTLFPVEVALTSIPGEHGFTLHTTWRDITQRIRLESELRHSQKMDAVGKLAGGVAHDFNNQLMPILGFAELLIDALQDDAELSEWASEIHTAATIAAATVNKLLSISRKTSHELIVLDMNAAVNSLAGLLRKLVGEEIAVNIQAADQPLWVQMVEGDIEQVVMNLAANSRDALAGGGVIQIMLSLIDEPGKRYARLKVTDDGAGMDAETLKYMYEPFFTTKEIGSGTGLGMSTVFNIVTNAGGRIDVSSRPGKGTTTVVDLPVISMATAGTPSDVAKAQETAAATAGKKMPHILVVDDNSQIASFVAQVLLEQGFRVSATDDGRTALEFLATETPDLILTDVIMRTMSGPALIKRLQEDGIEIPVLFMSGHADDRLSAAGLDVTRFDILRKPFTAGALIKRIKQSLALTAGDS